MGQNSLNKSHSHSITDPGHEHTTNFSQNNESGTFRYLSDAGGNNANRPISTSSVKTDITINSSGDKESRPNAITVKIWKRTA